MGFWLELIAEIFGLTAAEIIGDKTPRYIIVIALILIVLVLFGVVIYYSLIA